MREFRRDVNAVPPYPLPDVTLDLEAILPLELIREHTKTDDTPSVTDTQLSLYRSAAFEACELYTGMVFTNARVVREPVASHNNRGFRRVRKLHLRYAPIDGYVYMYGGGIYQPVQVAVQPGRKTITIPIVQEALDASSCCRPCSTGGENFGMSVMYRTGIVDIGKIPAIVKVGCLKYIAWAVKNPGDVLQSVRGKDSSQGQGIIGTNNGTWASGALEDWRQLTVEGAF